MIEEKQGNTTIFYTEHKKGSRIKILFAFEGLVLLCCGIGFVPMLINAFTEGFYFGFALLLAIDAFFVFGGVRFIIKIFDREKIIVSPLAYKIEVRKWLRTRIQEYRLADISAISYTGYSTKTDHPLKGQSYDYLGFETREMEITKLHDDGNLSLTCGDKTVVFGQNINTWDAQQISNVLSTLTEGRLTIQNLPEEIPEDVYMAGTDTKGA